MNPTASKFASLLGTASLVTMANAMAAHAQQVAQAQMAQAGPAEVPEQVLITGSLIHGAVAVGVPVTNLSPQDFAQTGALTTADLFRTIPAANVSPGPVAVQSGANIERATKVNLRGLDTGTATRSLLMVDGVRVPGQGNGTCEIDPSIIPAMSLDRIDILLDGASATYGSDAVAGVINIILKRGYDGAVSQVRFSTAQGGQQRYQASQLWGRTWDGGDITLSYEWYDESPIKGNAHSNLTVDFSPWGLNNRIPLASAMPGIISRGGAGFPVGGSASPGSGAPFANPALGYGTTGNLGTLCGNCFAIPTGSGVAFNPAVNGGLGPLAPSSAGLPWTTYSGNGGTSAFANEFNPYSIAWYSAAQQRNGGAITVDQRLTKDITFYGEGFYSNRRAEYLNPANISPDNTNLLSVAVPTWNPYYPTGAGAGTLRVNYSLAIEHPSTTFAYELADRYLGGFHIALPFDWNGDLYYSETYDSSSNNVNGTVNVNAVSAALGWTIAAIAPSGSAPSLGTWTKPGAVPYLNLFCDARTLQCNSQTTEQYIQGIRKFDEKFWVNEKGAKFDGPLFDLPAGQAKAAVGFTYTTFNWNFRTIDSTQAASLLVPIVNESVIRHVWAGFAQVNIPLVGDNNKFPLFQKLNLEASWRHDQYSDFGGTSNPKVAVDWSPIEWFTFKFAWGTNFRAPSVGETSRLANNAIAEQNDPLGVNAPILISCTPGPNSGFDRLVNPGAGLTGFTLAPGACNTSAANPVGISMNGGAGPVVAAGWRSFVNTRAQVLQPEQAMNWAVGGEFAPTTFLRGLDIQATWYTVKLTGLLAGFGNPQSSTVNDSSRSFAYIVPTDLAFLHTAPGDLQCHNNNTPGAAAVGGAPGTGALGCPEFEQMVVGILADPRNTVPVAEQTKVLWLNDGGTFNLGYQRVTGIDWQASYDIDLGDLGAWNAGITGTYYLHQYSQSIPGGAVLDAFHTRIDNGNVVSLGVPNAPRLRYRARLGWSDGPWSLTGFMDYQAHFFHGQTAPPNVNNQCTSAGGIQPGGTFPCLVTGYTNIEPSWVTFDLSMGYDTGDDPANDYLKHLGIQLVVSNIMDKHAAFEYRTGTGGGNPAAMDILKPNQGRTISLILTKTW
jgi:outer membrane receptor protein involved in Fe transport